jgi:hypothetical protein
MAFERFSCPCCDYLTFEHPTDGSYDICSVCFWEDDLVQKEDPDYAGGANRVSLNEARANFVRYGAMEERFAPNVRAPLPDEIQSEAESGQLPR